VFPDFYGNSEVVGILERMIARRRVPQTLLIDGPAGAGKATLVRRFAAALVGDARKIEQDDLSLASNRAILADREKWASDKRAEDPLLFASHPDFLTFPPDGPLRQISIQQMRELKERARFQPLRGERRVFLIDGIDRAGEHAANSLLKVLEEPPPYLVLVMTAVNPYDLLPTIRSRAVPFHLAPLGDDEMRRFAASRKLDQAERRLPLAAGSPGLAVSVDLDTFDRRRAAMVKLLEVSAGRAPFADWLKHSESIASRKTEKLDFYLDVLYILLGDLVRLRESGAGLRNPDLEGQLRPLAEGVSFEWIRRAVGRVDELVELLRRNIQKSIALDAFALELRSVC
jgi:DNA polymerase III subunit delta'